MMGHRQVEQAALFYEFSLEKHVPADHLLRSIDRFVDLQQIRRDLASFYSSIGRPSVDPKLMIRMLLVGYCFGIRSERRLCDTPRRAGFRPTDNIQKIFFDTPKRFGWGPNFTAYSGGSRKGPHSGRRGPSGKIRPRWRDRSRIGSETVVKIPED